MRHRLDSTPRLGLLAGGNWLLDYVKVVDCYPKPESLASILSQTQGTGGAPYNVLIALARSGAPFPLAGAGLVGRDPAGAQIRKHCRQYGIDIRHLGSTADAPTAFTDVMTEHRTGRRTFFHDRGANALWDGRDLDFDRIRSRFFHVGYFLLLDALDRADAKFGTRAARLLAAAQRAGLKTSVDAVTLDDPRLPAIASAALPFTDYCFLNEHEAAHIAGTATRGRRGRLNARGIMAAADELLRRGIRELAVIHFPEGALARSRHGEAVWQPSLRVPARWIAGTAGAGDAFCAGVLWGLHEGWNLERSLLTGTCIAAAALSHPTTTGGVRSLRHSLSLAKKFGFNPPLD